MRDPQTWRRLGLSALSGLIAALAFPPLDLGPLVLVGLIPLLWALRGARPGVGAWCGFVYGAALMGIVCSWIVFFGAVAIVPFVLWMGVYTAGAGFVVAWLARRGIANPWVVAAAFTVFEALRGLVPFGGLAWGELGVALHDLGPARALASFGGVPLLTFLVVLVNAALLDLALAIQRGGWRSRPTGLAAGLLAGVLAVTVMGTAFRFQPEETGELRFAMLQANDVNRYFTPEELLTNPLTTRHFDLAEQLEGDYDLIVFPESGLDTDPFTDEELHDRIVALAEKHNSVVLVNANVEGPDGTVYNQNIAYGPDGEVIGTYSKRHLVPFGEYVPWPWLRDVIPALGQIARDYTPGPGRTTFDVDGHEVGTAICFESTFPRSLRGYVADGAEMIVITTNNRSYRRSANSAQHVAMSQMRAAELGRPVLHAAISGITAAIDADGDVLSESELFEVAITEGTIATTTGTTPYARVGDWALAVSVVVLVGAAVAAIVRSRRSADATEATVPDADAPPVAEGTPTGDGS